MTVLCVSVASVALAESDPEFPQRHSAGAPTLKLHKMVGPIYPEAALKNGIGGTVVVEVLIDKQGVPQAVHALRGDPALARTVSQGGTAVAMAALSAQSPSGCSGDDPSREF
jgi:TonB family protein